jgi:hypothetical protein
VNVPESVLKIVDKVVADHLDEPDEYLVAVVLGEIRALPDFEAIEREVLRSVIEEYMIELSRMPPPHRG